MVHRGMATILSINNILDDELRALGHEVYSVSITDSGLYSAAVYVEQCPTKPDIFLQHENLGAHIFFPDVHTLSCSTAFWGIDSHLRYWWQMFHAAQFDVFFTPHKAFLERLSKEWLHPRMHRLAYPAPQRAYVPHAQRDHTLNFVGRLSGTRQKRQKICDMLASRYGVQHLDNIDYFEMLNLYDATRIIPNESISNESNFRLLEAAACGCAVISPDIGQDQDVLFMPDEDILVYTSIESLAEQIDRCNNDPAFAEALGRKAWERVQKEHLPKHRAAEIIRVMEDFATQEPQKTQDDGYMPNRHQTEHMQDMLNFALSIMHLADVLRIDRFESFLKKPYHNVELHLIVQIFVLLFAEEKKTLDAQSAQEQVYALLDQANVCLMRPQGFPAHKKALAVACGGAALHYNDAPRGSFYLHLYEKITFPTQKKALYQSLKGASDTIDVAINWAHALKLDNKQHLCGSHYIIGGCRTALDFTFICRHLDSSDLRWVSLSSTLNHLLAVYSFEDQDSIYAAVCGELTK